MSEHPQAVRVEREAPGQALVWCGLCGRQIERVQTDPTKPDADEEQVKAEIRLIVEEHRALCGQAGQAG